MPEAVPSKYHQGPLQLSVLGCKAFSTNQGQPQPLAPQLKKLTLAQGARRQPGQNRLCLCLPASLTRPHQARGCQQMHRLVQSRELPKNTLQPAMHPSPPGRGTKRCQKQIHADSPPVNSRSSAHLARPHERPSLNSPAKMRQQIHPLPSWHELVGSVKLKVQTVLHRLVLPARLRQQRSPNRQLQQGRERGLPLQRSTRLLSGRLAQQAPGSSQVAPRQPPVCLCLASESRALPAQRPSAHRPPGLHSPTLMQ